MPVTNVSSSGGTGAGVNGFVTIGSANGGEQVFDAVITLKILGGFAAGTERGGFSAHLHGTAMKLFSIVTSRYAALRTRACRVGIIESGLHCDKLIPVNRSA